MDILDQYQSLVGSLVTLIAAFIGFSGIIYSQRSTLRQAEASRVHKERLDRENSDKDRRDQLISFLNAIMGEVASLGKAIDRAIHVVNAQIGICEELARGGMAKKIQPRISFRFITPVFDTHVAQIGLLSPELSFKVSNLYGQFKNFNSQSQDQVPEIDATVAARIMKSVVASLSQLATEASELRLGLEENANQVSRMGISA